MRPSPRPGLPGGKANAPSGNPASAGFLFSCFRRHCRARAAEGYTAPYAGPAPCGKRCSQPRPPPQDAGPPPEGSPPTRDLPACRRAFRVRQSRSIRRRALPWAADLTSSARLLLHAEGPPRTLREKTKKNPVRLFLRKTGQRGHGSPAPEESFARQTLRLPFPRAAPPGNEALPLFAKKNAFCRFM